MGEAAAARGDSAPQGVRNRGRQGWQRGDWSPSCPGTPAEADRHPTRVRGWGRSPPVGLPPPEFDRPGLRMGEQGGVASLARPRASEGTVSEVFHAGLRASEPPGWFAESPWRACLCRAGLGCASANAPGHPERRPRRPWRGPGRGGAGTAIRAGRRTGCRRGALLGSGEAGVGAGRGRSPPRPYLGVRFPVGHPPVVS